MNKHQNITKNHNLSIYCLKAFSSLNICFFTQHRQNLFPVSLTDLIVALFKGHTVNTSVCLKKIVNVTKRFIWFAGQLITTATNKHNVKHEILSTTVLVLPVGNPIFRHIMSNLYIYNCICIIMIIHISS